MPTWVYIILGLIVSVFLFDELLRLKYIIAAKRHGAKALPVIRLSRPLGLRNLSESIKALREFRILELMHERVQSMRSKTFLVEMAGRMVVATMEPENIKTVLATSFKDYSLGRRHEGLGYFLGDGIFTLSGEGWKHSRAMLRPQFSREQVGQLRTLKGHAQVLVDKIKREPRLDFNFLFHQLTMDTATEFLFGESTDTLTGSQKSRNGVTPATFVEDYTICLSWSIRRLISGPLGKYIRPKRFRDAIERSRRFVDYFVQNALEATEYPDEKATDSYIFTHELAKVTRDPVIIRDQAFNVLLAGRDTTASLLGYVTWYMGNYPEIYAKLREAVSENFGTSDDSITFESIKRCTYLSWVINEALRLNPLVPRNSRTAIRDTWLPRGAGPNEDQPVFVPKGTEVAYAAYIVQRDKDYWGPDADEFRPERWGEHTKTHSWDYIPFNGGPRICLGQQFALTEASFIIIRIAQEFERIALEPSTFPLPKNEVRLTSNVAQGIWGTAVPANRAEVKA